MRTTPIERLTMKSIFRHTITFIFVLFASSCANLSEEVRLQESDKLATNEATSLELFEQWLNNRSLTLNAIEDTTFRVPYHGLWTESRKTNREDSLNFWYPSSDSSFYFVTDLGKGDTLSIEDSENHEFVVSFYVYEMASNTIFPWLILYSRNDYPKIHHYWLDNDSFIITSLNSDDCVHALDRQNMFSDTIWYYHFAKNNLPTFRVSD